MIAERLVAIPCACFSCSAHFQIRPTNAPKVALSQNLTHIDGCYHPQHHEGSSLVSTPLADHPVLLLGIKAFPDCCKIGSFNISRGPEATGCKFPGIHHSLLSSPLAGGGFGLLLHPAWRGSLRGLLCLHLPQPLFLQRLDVVHKWPQVMMLKYGVWKVAPPDPKVNHSPDPIGIISMLRGQETRTGWTDSRNRRTSDRTEMGGALGLERSNRHPHLICRWCCKSFFSR